MQFQLYTSARAQNKRQSYTDKRQQTQSHGQEMGAPHIPTWHRTLRSPAARQGEAPRVYL